MDSSWSGARDRAAALNSGVLGGDGVPNLDRLVGDGEDCGRGGKCLDAVV